MPESDEAAEREAKHGEKMIEVKLRFWTDKIAKGKGKVQPKHAWAAGVVRMERNPTHGISPKQPIPFNSLLELGSVIEQALIDHGVRLHSTPRMKKYLGEK